jgi:hypothetical protein
MVEYRKRFSPEMVQAIRGDWISDSGVDDPTHNLARTVINIAQTPHMLAPHLIPDGEVRMFECTYSTHHEII